MWQVNKIIIKQHSNKQRTAIVEGNKITDISFKESEYWDRLIKLSVTSGCVSGDVLREKKHLLSLQSDAVEPLIVVKQRV